MCELVHGLEITNVKNHETFHYPVVLVKGHITNPCPVGQLKLVATGDRRPSFSVTVERLSRDVGERQAVHRNFRALLRLLAGEVEYEVQYCNTGISLTLNYTALAPLYTVVPLYIVCKGHTGRYQSHRDDPHNDVENACQKITLAIELLQCLYAEKLHEHGFGRKTFTLGSPCVPFRSELEWARSTSMTEHELWHQFATELVHSKQYDLGHVKVVAFLSSTHFEGISDGDFSYENIRRKTTGHAALGGGGLALFGTGCLYTWPETLEAVCDAFLSHRPVNCQELLDDSNYRRTYGGCFATTLGSVCHEMGHTFDLGHTPDGSIMGDGFDGIDSVFIGPPSSSHENAQRGSGPKRLIETKPHGQASKLTQLKRPGDVFRRRLEAKQNDNVFFAPISALTLCHHRWFNPATCQPQGTLGFDARTRTVASTTGSSIVLAELRLTVNGMMQKCWSFREPQTAVSFTLPKLPNLSDQTLFVMDGEGNILKVDLRNIGQAKTRLT